MLLTTPGLVLRVTKTGESDRVLSILTPQLGVISAIAKGSLRLRSKLHSATGLFCYAEFALFQGKGMFVVDDAAVKEVFFGLHEDVEAMALAMYCAEFTATLSPEGEDAEKQLRLLLNTLYLLSEKKRPPRLVKAVFEIRALSTCGYMPDLVACAGCMKYDGGAFYFDPEQAQLLCAECAAKQDRTPNLEEAALAAMRHAAYAEDAKLFSFQLGEAALAQFGAAAGQYALYCLDKPLKTLPFLETVLT